MLNFASVELNGSPLWNFTPGRSLKRHVVCPSSFHSVARPGYSLPSGCRLVRLSNRLNETRMSLEEVLKCGSNRATSPPWAVTSSRFWVLWARAGAGSDWTTAPPIPATAPLSRSRRETFMDAPPQGVRTLPCADVIGASVGLVNRDFQRH